MSDVTTCNYCQMNIPAKAQKCHICNEFQSPNSLSLWQRLLKILKELAGVITAFSTLTGVFVLWKFLPLSQVSDISVYDASSDPAQFTFLVSNDGPRSAFLGPIRIQYDTDIATGAAGHRAGMRILDPAQSIVSREGTLVLTVPSPLPKEGAMASDRCLVTLEIWDRNASEPRHVQFDRPCYSAPAGARWSSPPDWNRSSQPVEN